MKKIKNTKQVQVPKSLFKYNNWNYVDKINRLYKWMNRKQAPPYKIIIVPSNRCNLNCYACPNSYARATGRFKEEEELSDKEWINIVKEGLKLGVKEWYILGGGEPLIRKDLCLRIIKLIKKSDQHNVCEIITNGTLLEEKDIKELIKLKMDRLLISIDGADSETHDYLRRTKGAFNKASKNLRLFHEYKEKFKIDKPIVQMNSVINTKNFNKIQAITKFAIDNHVDELALHPMREYDEIKHQIQHLKLDAKQQEEMFLDMMKAKNFADKNNMFLNISMVEESFPEIKEKFSKNEQEEVQEEKQENRTENTEKKPIQEPKQNPSEIEKYISTRCYEPFYSIFIDPKGNVNYCCAAGDGKDENSLKGKTINELWHSDFFSKVRDIIKQGKATEKCFDCGLLDMTQELKEDMKKYVEYIQAYQSEN